jgi:hypothetical protein
VAAAAVPIVGGALLTQHVIYSQLKNGKYAILRNDKIFL